MWVFINLPADNVAFVPPDDTESWCCLMSKYFGRSSPAIISFWVKRRSGDVAWIDKSAMCGKAEKKEWLKGRIPNKSMTFYLFFK